MEVHLTQEQELRLRETAARSGRNPEALVTEAVERFLVSDEREIHELRAAIDEGDADIEAGNYADYNDESLHEVFAGIKQPGRRTSPLSAKPPR